MMLGTLWFCAGCGQPCPDRIAACDCPTQVVSDTQKATRLGSKPRPSETCPIFSNEPRRSSKEAGISPIRRAPQRATFAASCASYWRLCGRREVDYLTGARPAISVPVISASARCQSRLN